MNANVYGVHMTSPRVSVVMAAYNAEKFITMAINSVLQEKVIPLEVIIADDHSTDSTASIVKTIADKDSRVRLIQNAANGGPSYSRNRAISEAKGEWIAVLDADDKFQTGRLVCLLLLGEETGAEVVCDYLRPVNEQGFAVEYQKMYPIIKSGEEWMVLTPSDFIRSDMPGCGGIKAGYLKPIMKRNMLKSESINYDESVRVGEDALLLFDCLIKGFKTVVTKKSYYDYRMTKDSLSRRVSNDNLDVLQKVNQKMLHMASQVADKNISNLLSRRAALYDCACQYQVFVQSIKKWHLIKAAREICFNTQCLGYFFKTFMQRLMMRIKVSDSR